jgi:hypothetical protein
VTVITRHQSDQLDHPTVYHHFKESSVNRSLRLVAALGMLALPSLAHAQVTGSITASADIATVFSFGTPVPLNFGNVTPGSGALATGYIPLSRNIGVIYSLPDGATTGQLAKGTATLQPSYVCGVGSTTTTIASSFTNCNTTIANQLTLAAPTTGTLTEYVIFKGTLLGTQTDIAPGTYSGTIRITATGN